MKTVLNHIVLAFILATQMIGFMGCTTQIKTFECKSECATCTMQCATHVNIHEIDYK